MKTVIKKDKDLANWIFIFLTITLTVSYNIDFRTTIIPIVDTSLLQICTYLLAAFLLFDALLKGKIYRPGIFVKWSVTVIAFFCVSSLWAINSMNVISTIINLISMFLLLSGLSFYTTNYGAIEKILQANYIAISLCGIYLIRIVDFSSLGSNRIGATVKGLELWNANAIGLMMSVGALLAFYYFGKSKKFINKVVHLLLMALFVVVCLFTGSRKALFVLFLSTFGYLWFKNKGVKKIGVAIGALSIALITFILIMDVPALYDILGQRIENFLDGVFGSGTTEQSMLTREIMIELGWTWFLQKPILGYGIDCYKYLYGSVFTYATYSHNNFIEILVSGGIIGFAIYYSIYFIIIKKSWKSVKTAQDTQTLLLFVINIVFLIMQWGLVSYSDLLVTMFIMLLSSKQLQEKSL